MKTLRFTSSPLFVFFASFGPVVALLVAVLMGHRLAVALPWAVMLQALLAAVRARSLRPLVVVAYVLIFLFGAPTEAEIQESDALKFGNALVTLVSGPGLAVALALCAFVTLIGFIPTRSGFANLPPPERRGE